MRKAIDKTILARLSDRMSILQPGNDYPNLPQLPGNARYIYHLNECYDWGTFGWLLRSGEIRLQRYKYFILMNSSVRGPFIPPYVPVSSPFQNMSVARVAHSHRRF